MTSRTGSLTNFSGEPKEEKVDLCFIVRGEPTALLGDSGGALPAGKREGNGLPPLAFIVQEFPGAPKEVPAFASLTKDFTCNNAKNRSLSDDKYSGRRENDDVNKERNARKLNVVNIVIQFMTSCFDGSMLLLICACLDLEQPTNDQ